MKKVKFINDDGGVKMVYLNEGVREALIEGGWREPEKAKKTKAKKDEGE